MTCFWFSHEWVIENVGLWFNNRYPVSIELDSPGAKGVKHYNDVTVGTITSQITKLTIAYSIVYSDADIRHLYQSSASLAFVRGIHRSPVNSPHKWPITRKIFPFDDVIMKRGSPQFPHSTYEIRWNIGLQIVKHL